MERKGMAASLAAVGGVLAMASCCLPLPFLAAAAGVAGWSNFSPAARWWLIPVSLASLGYGFYQTYACRRCSRPSLGSRVILWSATVAILVLLLFPQWVALTLMAWSA